MKDIHLNPKEAVQAHVDLHSEQSLGMHFGVFQLTWEPVNQPVIDLNAAEGPSDRRPAILGLGAGASSGRCPSINPMTMPLCVALG